MRIATIEIKAVLFIFVNKGVLWPFPNFMANIGISLTINAESTIAKAGRNQHPCTIEDSHVSGDIAE